MEGDASTGHTSPVAFPPPPEELPTSPTCVCVCVCMCHSGGLDFGLHHQRGKEDRRERRLQQQPEGSHIPAYVNELDSAAAVIEAERHRQQQAGSPSL